MSIVLWNPNIKPNGDWEVQSTRKASGMLVLDTEGNYKSENVEDALLEVANQVKKINNEIKYINENGTIGGGGGGGGSSVPAIKVDGDLSRIATTDQEIIIYYYFQSPNPGNGKANLTIGLNGRDFVTTEVDIKQGRNKWILPPQPKGSHTYSIYVVDSAALYSNVVDINITVGALELKSTFDQYFDFTLAMPVTIDFEISAIKPDPVTVEIIVDGNKEIMAGIIGMNRWSKQFTTLGVKKISIVAIAEGIKSNILEYTIVIADSINLYISSTWPAESQVTFNTNVTIPYRLSLIGNSSFIAEYYIDDVQIDRVTAKVDNYWNIGRDLQVRVAPYRIKIKAFTKDLQTWSELSFLLTVTEAGFTKVFEVKDKLIASFNGSGKNNDSDTRNVWQGYAENGTVGATATLYNFNYRTSGWFEDSLVFAGKAYATVNIAPLANEIITGFTFDILFKTENSGDIDAIVADFCNNTTPFQGFTINTQKATMTSVQNKTADAKFREKTWTRVTCTVDRTTNIMFMFINGIISRAILLHSSETFKYAGMLALGGKLVDGAITRIGSSAIKTMRIYSKALNYMEVLQNLISDLPTLEEQAAMTALNSPTLGIPTMKITGNIDIIMDGKSEAPVTIEYVYSQDPNQNFNKDNCYIQLQGTSSTGYPIKNFTIKLRDGGKEFYFPHNAGFINWLPEFRFTLKADFMDSSHGNNVGLARYCNDFFIANNNPYPTYTKNPKTRSTIQGYPINLVINNKSFGIYNFNLDRYANINYGFQGEPGCCCYEIAVNSNASAGGAGAFATADFEKIRTEFKHRYNYRYIEGQPQTEVTEIIVTGTGAERVETEVLKAGRHQELEDVVGWTFNASLYDFKSNALAEHWSIPHLIDYYLIVYVMGLVDSYGKNMVLYTLGRDPVSLDTVWYPTFYDMD